MRGPTVHAAIPNSTLSYNIQQRALSNPIHAQTWPFPPPLHRPAKMLAPCASVRTLVVAERCHRRCTPILDIPTPRATSSQLNGCVFFSLPALYKAPVLALVH